MTLYADLGVDPDASGDELRKAHRRQVQNTHPDKGGNREDFEKVQHAYMILRDPKTRSRYDETGEHDVQPDNELAEVGNMLVGAFDQAMQEVQGKFDISDLIAGTRKILANRKREAETNKGIMADAAKNFVKVRDRLSFKGGGADILLSSLNGKIAEAERMAAAFVREIETVGRADAYAADYGYRHDPAPVAPAHMSPEQAMRAQLERMMHDGRGGLFDPFRP